DLRPFGDPQAPSAQDHYAGLWSGADDAIWSSSGAMQATDYARTVLIATAAGIDPTRVAPHQHLVAKLARFWRDGYFQSRTALLNQTIFGLLAVSRVDAVPRAVVERLAASVEAAQHDDGGYSFATAETAPTVPGGPSPLAAPSNDLDFTGAALAALCGAGRTTADPSVSRAIAFLRTKRLASGAFGSSIGNVDSNAWVLQGLGACGVRRGTPAWIDGGFESTVDWLLATQRGDGAWPLYPEMSGTQPADAYATQDVLRALIDRPGLAVDPPARAAPGDPVRRPLPDVAPGAAISVALVIDDGLGSLELCEVPTVAGATLRELLQTARGSATPTGCVSGPRWESAALTVLNGRRAASPTGGWRWSLDGGATEAAADESRRVSAGDVVSLRLADPSSEIVPPDAGDPDPQPPGEDPPGEQPPYVPPYVPPFVPPYQPPFVPPPGDPAPPQRPRTTKKRTVRASCRRISRKRAVRCAVRVSGKRKLRVTAKIAGRRAVRKSGRSRVVVTIRSSRTIRVKSRVRLRVTVDKRSRTLKPRANKRTVKARV
ncbi:MAG: hypothetical protein ITG02_07125, partial [Patulibacter sp.]|nr:hypothetical protein [Patulibacter sp.]